MYVSFHQVCFVRVICFLFLTLRDGFQHVDLEAEERPVTPRTQRQLFPSPVTSHCVWHVISRFLVSWGPLDDALCSTSIRALVSRVAAPRWSEKRRDVPACCASPSALWSTPETLEHFHDRAWRCVILKKTVAQAPGSSWKLNPNLKSDWIVAAWRRHGALDDGKDPSSLPVPPRLRLLTGVSDKPNTTHPSGWIFIPDACKICSRIWKVLQSVTHAQCFSIQPSLLLKSSDAISYVSFASPGLISLLLLFINSWLFQHVETRSSTEPEPEQAVASRVSQIAFG